MSFALTTEQIKNKTKTVTRRAGWKFLKQNDFVQPVEKIMGLKKGEKIEKIGTPIKIISVRREALIQMHSEPMATAREGFPSMSVSDFIQMFCKHFKKKTYEIITRIEFIYSDTKLNWSEVDDSKK